MGAANRKTVFSPQRPTAVSQLSHACRRRLQAASPRCEAAAAAAAAATRRRHRAAPMTACRDRRRRQRRRRPAVAIVVGSLVTLLGQTHSQSTAGGAGTSSGGAAFVVRAAGQQGWWTESKPVAAAPVCVAAACLEHGAFDDDCCAVAADATCTYGHTHTTGGVCWEGETESGDTVTAHSSCCSPVQCEAPPSQIPSTYWHQTAGRCDIPNVSATAWFFLCLCCVSTVLTA